MWCDKKFGFGLMRLPKNGDEIDIPKVCALADEFLAKGFTYFDTAYVYGGSEVAFREAVAKRHPRESYTIANKLPGWLLSEENTPDVLFNEQLERCGVEYFDYYLLHSVQPSRVACYDNADCWRWAQKMKAEGKIKNFGFSFHGDPDLLDRMLTEHPEVDFVQLQINYVDWESNAIWSGANYEICRIHGKDIIVMEPVKGGFLANLKPELMEKFSAIRPDASAASYALRFVASLDGVKMVLSGMNEEEQMKDNLATFANFEPLTDEEFDAVDEVTKALLEVPVIPCTDCRYCMDGCPMNIHIPDIFKSYNMIQQFGEHDRPHFYYNGIKAIGSGLAKDCIGCGQCEAACPQHIEIIDYLAKSSELLD